MAKLLYLVTLLPTVVVASDFASRVKAGEAAAATPEGQQYQASWEPALQPAMVACIPVGSTSPANLGKFAFVADVTASGVVSSVEVEPHTAASLCFAQHFNGTHVPHPPSGALFPIADKMEVVP